MAGNEGAGLEATARDEREGLAADGRRVMEGGTKRDVAVVDAVGIECNVSVFSAAAEEVHGAALAHQFHRLLPRFGHADGLNGDIDAAVFGRDGARFQDGFAN